MDTWRTIDISYLTISIASGILCLTKLPFLLRPAQGVFPKQAWRVWIFLFLNFTVLFMLQTRPVYVFIDEGLGVNNLTWLLAYLVSIAGVSLFQSFAATLIQESVSRFEYIGRTVAILLLIGLYIGYLRHTPESLQRDIVRDVQEYYFVIIAHFWTGWSLLLPMRAFAMIIFKDEAARVRMLIFLSGTVLATAWLFLRIWHVSMLYFRKEDTVSFQLPVILILIGMTATIFMGMYHNSLYEQVSINLRAYINQVSIRLMEYLVQQLRFMGGGVPSISLSVDIRNTRPDLWLIQQVVYVADWSRLVEMGAISLDGRTSVNLHQKIRQMPTEPSSAIQYCCQLSIWWWVQRLIFTLRRATS